MVAAVAVANVRHGMRVRELMADECGNIKVWRRKCSGCTDRKGGQRGRLEDEILCLVRKTIDHANIRLDLDFKHPLYASQMLK